MINVNESALLATLRDPSAKNMKCIECSALINDLSTINRKTEQKVIDKKSVEHAANYCAERIIFYNSEFCSYTAEEAMVGINRIVYVNPGANNIGHEQRYVHFYIVLAEYKDMFIGLPITNKAYNRANSTYYLRNPYEVELVNPDPNLSKKPYNEFWVTKPSVADLRNVSGLDKRRIVKNFLYKDPKYAPKEYIIAIKQKMREIFSL